MDCNWCHNSIDSEAHVNEQAPVVTELFIVSSCTNKFEVTGPEETDTLHRDV